MNSIDWLLEIPALNGDRPFLVDARTGETVTFSALHRDGCRVAAELRRRGLRRGDRLGIVLGNSAAFARLYLGCLYAGVVTVPVNPTLARPEIESILGHSGARLVVASAETAARDLVPPGLDVVLLADGRGSAAPHQDPGAVLDIEGMEDDGVPALQGASPSDTMTIVYTSGTTGRPSGVVHRIADLVDNGRRFGSAVGINQGHRFYGVLAMTYLGGYYNLLMLPYVNQASVVIAEAFDARSALDFWSAASEHGVNALWLVPTIMSILLELDRGDLGERLCRDQVELTLVGTAPLAPSLRRAFEQRYGVRALENYGLSETLFLTTNVPERETVDGSVGRALDGVELMVDESQDGELLARTPYLMEGYFDPAQAGPAPLDRDAWFATGDVGRIDSQGNLFIEGRRKDIIIRGGVNVSPAAIEDVLIDHPDVMECAVVGVPHPMYGEDTVAVVRLAAGADEAGTRDELAAACRQRLGATNRPSRIIVFEQLPRSSSGKIRKHELRELVAGQTAMAQPR